MEAAPNAAAAESVASAPVPAAAGLTPTTFAEAMQLANVLASSGMVPKDYIGRPGAVFAAMELGRSVGLSPMQSLQGIASINGRPTIFGDTALAVVMRHRDFVSIAEYSPDEAKKHGFGKCVLTRRGQAPIERRFSVDDAIAAKLKGKEGPWSTYESRMLQMRARSWALRDLFPDALKGLAIYEEAIDVTGSSSVVEERPSLADMTPKATAPDAPAAEVPPIDVSQPFVSMLTKVDVESGKKKDGSDYTVYRVTFGGADSGEPIFKASTFDSGLGESAVAAQGHKVRCSVRPRGKSFELLSIESV